MLLLNDVTIETAIANISGYIVDVVASETGKPIEEISEAFLSSDTYKLLSDKETGYYWDSMSELVEMFKTEL